MPKCHIKSIFGKSSTSLPGYSKRWSIQRYPLQRYLPRQFTPISGAKSLEIVRGLASTPHFWCVVAGILDCHWKSHAVARQLFRISSMWPSNPNSSQRRWSWTPGVLAMSASPWQFVMGNVFLISLWKGLPQEPTWGLRKMNGKDHSHNCSDILKTCLFNHFDLKTWVLRFQLVFISPVRMFFTWRMFGSI